MSINAANYMHSICWVCTSCGFLLERGQPHMECPICEAYKESFINSPPHVETAVRATHKEHHNTADARRERLKLLREGGYLRSFRVKGRATEAVNRASSSRGLV